MSWRNSTIIASPTLESLSRQLTFHQGGLVPQSSVSASYGQVDRSGSKLSSNVVLHNLTQTYPMSPWCSNKSDKLHSLLTHETLGIGSVLDSERFSTTHKLCRVTSYVLKFVHLLNKQVASPELTRQDLTLPDQGAMDTRAIQDMEDPTSLVPRWATGVEMQGTSPECRSSVFSKASYTLNKKHHLTVRDAHHRVHHNGVREILMKVHFKFWIIGGRNLIRSIIHSCIVCRRFEGGPICASPQVKEAPPFTYSAVDFVGPMYLCGKEVNDSMKVWICLLTCCASHAIHLELILDMSTATFTRCIKRFPARWGFPRSFLSDNTRVQRRC